MVNKKSITLMVLTVIFTVFSQISFAQNMPGDKAGREADMLYRKLSLSDDQYTKVYSSLLDYYTKQQTHMKDYKNDKKACDEACMKDWQNVKSSMSSVLNKDQMASYSSMNERSMMYPVMRIHKKAPMTTPTTSTDKTTTDPSKKNEKKIEEPKKTVEKKTDTKTEKKNDNTKK